MAPCLYVVHHFLLSGTPVLYTLTHVSPDTKSGQIFSYIIQQFLEDKADNGMALYDWSTGCITAFPWLETETSVDITQPCNTPLLTIASNITTELNEHLCVNKDWKLEALQGWDLLQGFCTKYLICIHKYACVHLDIITRKII